MNLDEKERFIDEWLDRTLTQYGQAEPRPGLENRVLSAVRAERVRARPLRWRWQPVLAALSAGLLIAAALHPVRWKSANLQPPLAKQTPGEQRMLQRGQAKTAPVEAAANQKIHGAPRSHLQRVAAPARKKQFPSPEPLSEQEKILARYVQQFPREADLMAQAQTQLTREEMMAEQAPPEGEMSSSSEAQDQ